MNSVSVSAEYIDHPSHLQKGAIEAEYHRFWWGTLAMKVPQDNIGGELKGGEKSLFNVMD